VSQPNKHEQGRIDSIHRQLQKTIKSIETLNVYLVVNGRDLEVQHTISDVREHLEIAIEKLDPIVSKGVVE
jgi:hypothetical protein